MVLDEYLDMKGQLADSKRSGSTIEDWDLASLEKGEAIVSLAFSRPFRFHFDE